MVLAYSAIIIVIVLVISIIGEKFAQWSKHLAPVSREEDSDVRIGKPIKSYKRHKVLDGVNLTVNDGEMVALLGPSGSGKTTILRLIAGFLKGDSGAILVDGVDIAYTPSHKRNIGIVFQDYALFPHMTVEQNVEFGLKMHRVDRQNERNDLIMH